MDGLVDQKFNIRLVETVKKYPVIYNSNIKGYKKRPCVLLRQKAWKSIGEELNCDPLALHQKWHQFRKHFSHIVLLKQRGEHAAPYYLSEHLKFLIPYLKSTHESVASITSINEVNGDGKRKDKEEEEVNQYEIDEYQTAEELDEMDQDTMYLDNYSNDEAMSDETDVEAIKPHYNQNRKVKVALKRCATLLPTQVVPSSNENTEIEQFSVSGDPKLHFLLSLLPDLDAMSNSEMRKFKCKVQKLVDEILN